MVWSKQVKWINGNFTLAGHSADELAEKFGTPAFLLDEDDFRSRAREFLTEFSKVFGEGNVSVFYAGKAFLATRIANWLAEDGLSLDVCTGGELARGCFSNLTYLLQSLPTSRFHTAPISRA